jgi:hypothetical protein
MEKSRIEEIAMAVAMVEFYNEIIENAKEEIRNLSEEEIAEINKGKDLIIKRQNYTKTIYSKEYQEAKKELEKKFPPTKETTVNHTIKLQATAYTTSKRELITDKFTNLNKTQLKAASKNANIK